MTPRAERARWPAVLLRRPAARPVGRFPWPTWCLAALLGLACSSRGPLPRADLSEALPPQKAFLGVRGAWENEAWEIVMGLDGGLEAVIRNHPKDPTTRAAKAMRALIAVERGDLALAKRYTDELLALDGEGSTRDLANVVVGSMQRRQGDPRGALVTLEKLFNKVIDGPGRAFLNRELFLAAVATGQLQKAAMYLRALLKQSGTPLRAFAERETSRLLGQLPVQVVLGLLKEEVAFEEPDRWFSALLANHLADAVERDQDPQVARALLEIAAPLLGPKAEPIARIAARGADVRLERNTVGLLLPLRTEDLQRRGIEVASGLAVALDIPGGSTKLLVRDDQRDVSKVADTLALLNADGAAVIVAGYDTEEADIAAAYGERTGVPLVLLQQPSRPVKADGSVFVLGQAPTTTREVLVRALVARGRKRVALLVEERTRSDLAPDVAINVVAEQPCGASFEFLRTSGADAVVIDGGRSCTASALPALGGMGVAFGLDASVPGREGLVASAGLFPIVRKAKGSDPMLDTYRERKGGEPSWWAGLGHDAGLLVKDAVQGLPTEEGEAAAAVAIRKRLVTDAVAKSDQSLWTTEARGFDGARTMSRTIRSQDQR